jgi:hypothetical protein
VKNPGALAVRPGHSTLILRRASESRPDDYSVFHEGQRVGRIYRMHSTDRELWYWAEIGARAEFWASRHPRSSGGGFPPRLGDAEVAKVKNPAPAVPVFIALWDLSIVAQCIPAPSPGGCI